MLEDSSTSLGMTDQNKAKRSFHSWSQREALDSRPGIFHYLIKFATNVECQRNE